MKKLVLSSLFFTTALVSNVNAAELVNGDGSNYSDVCIAATVSKAEVNKQAKKFGFTKSDLQSFNCNGLSLKEFGKKYAQGKVGSELVKIYAFTAENSAPETQICIAAATSEKRLKEVKQDIYGNKAIEKISCNGLSLKEFTKRYRSK